MLDPHLPPPSLGPGEGRPTPCTFGIPDGSYRCLALEAEESGGEDSLQGEAGLMDAEGEREATRSGDHFVCRAIQGTTQLTKNLGIHSPIWPRETRGDAPPDSLSNQNWNLAKAQMMTANSRPGPGSKEAPKPGKFLSLGISKSQGTQVLNEGAGL